MSRYKISGVGVNSIINNTEVLDSVGYCTLILSNDSNDRIPVYSVFLINDDINHESDTASIYGIVPLPNDMDNSIDYWSGMRSVFKDLLSYDIDHPYVIPLEIIEYGKLPIVYNKVKEAFNTIMSKGSN